MGTSKKMCIIISVVFCLVLSVFGLDQDIEDRVTVLMDQMSVDEKIEQLHASAFFDTPDNNRLQIPGFHVCDGPHGVRNESGGGIATSFPVGIAMTATWDPEYMEQVGWAMAREFRGYGRNTVLGPCTDIQRDPRNGRSAESCGEDPFLGGKINAALIRGIQSTHAIATVKHFAATNQQARRTTDNHVMDERTLREFYGLPFRMAVQEADVWSIMCAYNWVNGTASSENYDLLTRLLRNEWGYEYFVMSDWWATYSNAANPINAGLDVEMPENGKYPNGLKQALESGEVSMDVLDEAVRRVLRTKIKAGLLDSSTPPGDAAHINSDEHKAINLEAGKKSIVLLKNENDILPLNKQAGSIALIGPNADRLVLDGFGSSKVDPFYVITPHEGIKQTAPDVNVRYEQGCDINSDDTSGFRAARDAAANADYVIFVGGLDDTQEGEGYGPRSGKDRESGSVQLPGKQQDLINELALVNPNIIVVLQSGGICSVTDSLPNIKGLIYAWYCGNEGGKAIAQVLFGDYNPGGKLPVTMPASDAQLPSKDDLDFSNDMINGIGYRKFDAENLQPLFAFGHGLSYTTFEYSNLLISGGGEGSESVTVSVDITNSGDRDGDEVVQLYLTHNDAAVLMPEKQLKGFRRVTLSAGETKTVSMVLTPYELSYWASSRHHYFVESGTYTVRVGGASDNLVLTDTFEVTGDYNIPYANDKLSVSVLSPAAGAVVDKNVAVSWYGYDPENDPLTFDVELWDGSEWTSLAAGLTGTSLSWDSLEVEDGVYTIRVTAGDGAETVSAVSGHFSVRNHGGPDINLALNRPVTVSSEESSELAGAQAVDGNAETRWASLFNDSEWISVDLGKSYDISRVILNWEAAYGAEYEIQVSKNGTAWSTARRIEAGDGATDEVLFPAVSGRYVRMFGTKRATVYGFSLYEFEVYGSEGTEKFSLTTSVTGNGSIQTLGGSYLPGTYANLIALPAEGWKFAGWTGDLTGTEANTSILMDSDKNVTAVFEEDGEPSGDLAKNKQVSVSSAESSELSGEKAVDGSGTTRWSSEFSDTQWITVNLGALYDIERVVLNWEAAFGADYEIQVSDDGTSFTTVAAVTGGNGAKDEHTFPAVRARYVRMYGTRRATVYGFSLYDFEVYGSEGTEKYILTTSVNGNGTIQTGGTTYDPGSYADLTAVPAAGWKFTGWSGDLTGTGSTASLLMDSDKSVTALFEENEPSTDLAKNKNVTASSIESSDLSGSNAVDGNGNSRWSSEHSDPQWISVDLGTNCTVSKVVLNWETAYGRSYTIQVSSDGYSWTTVYSETSGNGGSDILTFDPVETRYVKMNGISRGTRWGYSLFDFEVYTY